MSYNHLLLIFSVATIGFCFQFAVVKSEDVMLFNFDSNIFDFKQNLTHGGVHAKHI